MATLQQRVYRIVQEQFGVRQEEVTPEKNFEDDLGADSIDMVEFVMGLEDEFEIEISDEEAEGIETVQQLLDYLRAKFPDLDQPSEEAPASE